MDVEAIVGVTAIAFGVASLLAGAYIWNIYRQRHEEALFLTRLVHRDLRVAGASAVIAALIANAYINVPLERPWGAVIIGVCLIVLMAGPIGDALLWRKERKNAASPLSPKDK